MLHEGEATSPEASSVLTTMRLCEHFHITPQELREIDAQVVSDWITILRYDNEIARERQADAEMEARRKQ